MPGEPGSDPSNKAPVMSEPTKVPHPAPAPPTTTNSSSTVSRPPPTTNVSHTKTAVTTASSGTPVEKTTDLRDIKDLTHDLDKMEDLAEALSPGEKLI